MHPLLSMSKDYKVNVIPPDPAPLRVNISVQLYEVIAVNEPKQVNTIRDQCN